MKKSLAFILLFVVVVVFFLEARQPQQPQQPHHPLLRPEYFAGSDWNTAFWGQSVWNGWNYGSAAPRTAPRPEMS